MKKALHFGSCIVLLLLFSGKYVYSVEQGECTVGGWSLDNRREALAIINGKEIAIEGPESPFVKKQWKDVAQKDDDSSYYYVLDESKHLLYVPNFLNASLAQELTSFCLTQNRFVRSPIRGKEKDTDSTTQVDDIRTSESCALVPASTYLQNPRFLAIQQEAYSATNNDVDPQTAAILREVDVTWDISQRAASVLDWDAQLIEPLQLVRYASPKAQYKLHHDHGGFYGKETLEQRPYTMLVFLNDVRVGGYTSFPKLNNLKVAPRGGDAIVWSNVKKIDSDDGKVMVVVDPDMVHAGEPPGEEGIEKYAVNIWFGDASFSVHDVSRAGKWTTAAEEENGA